MGWFQKFMYGRRGGDQLGMALLVLSLVLQLVGTILGAFWIVSLVLRALSAIALFLTIYRMFSKNLAARSKENAWFLKTFKPVTSWFSQQIRHFRDRKTHRYLRCGSCKLELRVPRGKGKISVTCPKCGNKTTVVS